MALRFGYCDALRAGRLVAGERLVIAVADR